MCSGVTGGFAIQCFLINGRVGIGRHLHVRDDGVVVTVNDGDLEEVDVAQVRLDVGMTWRVIDHLLQSGGRFWMDDI